MHRPNLRDSNISAQESIYARHYSLNQVPLSDSISPRKFVFISTAHKVFFLSQASISSQVDPRILCKRIDNSVQNVSIKNDFIRISSFF